MKKVLLIVGVTLWGGGKRKAQEGKVGAKVCRKASNVCGDADFDSKMCLYLVAWAESSFSDNLIFQPVTESQIFHNYAWPFSPPKTHESTNFLLFLYLPFQWKNIFLTSSIANLLHFPLAWIPAIMLIPSSDQIKKPV